MAAPPASCTARESGLFVGHSRLRRARELPDKPVQQLAQSGVVALVRGPGRRDVLYRVHPGSGTALLLPRLSYRRAAELFEHATKPRRRNPLPPPKSPALRSEEWPSV